MGEELKKPTVLELFLMHYQNVGTVKSIRRAIRRGHISILGTKYPKRPFNNRANTCKRGNRHSRGMTNIVKNIYGEIKRKQLGTI